MNDRSITYRREVHIAGQSNQALTAVLEYVDADPYQVRLALIRNRNTVFFEFARDLLVDGLSAPTGEGDVQVRPHDTDPGLLTLTLTPEGAYPYEVDVDRAWLTDFVTQSDLLVPEGEEPPVDMDAELAALLGGA